ncbi:hypothetical protein BHE74_00057184 [Ensete ventricosum]|nr:hypothetical protein BHE74_00057184 [Ensete ventricosum]
MAEGWGGWGGGFEERWRNRGRASSDDDTASGCRLLKRSNKRQRAEQKAKPNHHRCSARCRWARGSAAQRRGDGCQRKEQDPTFLDIHRSIHLRPPPSFYAAGPPPTATIDAATLEIVGTHAKQRQQLAAAAAAAAAAANFKRDSMEPSKSLLVF